jgi:alpha-ribazole phosphatase
MTTVTSIADLLLIRHAPSVDGGAMAGRRDVAADCSNAVAIDALRARVNIGAGDTLHASPALRCQQTATALWGDAARQDLHQDPRLREQDFGDWEGVSYANLPDIGPMAQAALAAFAPPNGESFDALCARAAPALLALPAGRHIIVAHAGIVRAALGIALGAAHLGLGFSVAPLSLTRLSRDMATGTWAIHTVNWTAP